MPETYSCRGQNTSPPLNIAGVPSGSKSLALIMHDPDAVGGDFVHWTLWNISPATESIAENSAPMGAAQGTNSAGREGYMGACPPKGTGTHRYIFELYALDITLQLGSSTNRAQLEAALDKHVLAHTTLTGLFSAEQ